MRTYVQPIDFDLLHIQLRMDLSYAAEVEVGEWQAIRGDIPQATTIELEDVSIETILPENVEDWQEKVKPNLPWAEDHLQERVSGIPYNPPPSSEYWPFAQKNNDGFKTNTKFSHTYPERMWPIYAGGADRPHEGIRYVYGDLQDVVNLLHDRPGTRQAYLPIWFPEDTGSVENQRVPCTLGYHFMIRHGQLKVVYYIRSCDFLRHFRDDVYMAGRLAQWIVKELQTKGDNLTTDRLVMHISSLHVFSVEREILRNPMNQLTS